MGEVSSREEGPLKTLQGAALKQRPHKVSPTSLQAECMNARNIVVVDKNNNNDGYLFLLFLRRAHSLLLLQNIVSITKHSLQQ